MMSSTGVLVRPIARLLNVYHPHVMVFKSNIHSSSAFVEPPMASTSNCLEMESPIVTKLMDAWTTEAFNTSLIRKKMEIPKITKPDQLLLKVEASSLNPIDVRLTEGYGDELLSKWCQLEKCNYNPLSLCSTQQFARLPLVAGRDFSAKVVAVGSSVQNYIPGDEVIGVIPVHWQGAHAEYCVAPVYGVAKKPLSVSHAEATTMPYAACTAWNALVTVARINPSNVHDVRVLIHGGSGGVGTIAIQLLKAWGVPKIVATCSEKNCEMVEKLGAKAIDYNSPTVKEKIIAEGPFEVILDCADSELCRWSDQIMGIWRNCIHVSLVSTLLGDTDRYGAPVGVATTLLKVFFRSYKIKPVVDKIYSFSDIPQAYQHAGKGHVRGKIVVDFSK